MDFAQAHKDLSDTHLPQAKKIILFQENLNTHKPASLYKASPAAWARRLVEFDTPKHGSSLVIDGNTCSRTRVGAPDRTRALEPKV
jgi:hypothetical protein